MRLSICVLSCCGSARRAGAGREGCGCRGMQGQLRPAHGSRLLRTLRPALHPGTSWWDVSQDMSV